MTSDVFRDDHVHLCSEMCDTCIYQPGNLMHLRPGRLKDMTTETLAREGGHVVCHKTLAGGKDNLICRGWWDRYWYRHNLFRLAVAWKVIREVDPPNELEV